METKYIIAIIVAIIVIWAFTRARAEPIEMRSSLEQSRYGIAPLGGCSDPPCLYGNTFRALASDCATIGGTTVGRSQAAISAAKGTPAEYVPCNAFVSTGSSAKYGIGPRATCAKWPIIARTTGATCRAIGGQAVGFPRDNESTDCQLGLCPIAQAPLRLVPVSTPNKGTIILGADLGARCSLMGGKYSRDGKCAFGVL
jgi:hypothetical protein